MTTQPDPARTVRRRRMHERQAVVFGLLFIALSLRLRRHRPAFA